MHADGVNKIGDFRSRSRYISENQDIRLD